MLQEQELNFGHMELTFLRFSVKMVIKKTSEYCSTEHH